MIRNYFITTTRNIWRNKAYSIINAVGLSIGLSVALLLFIYAQYEHSYENFHRNAKQVYRVILNDPHFDQSAKTGLALAPLLKSDFPEIKKIVRIAYIPEIKIEHHNEFYAEKRIVFADPEIFEVFSYELSEGNTKNALSEPNAIVISREIAKKYFGNANPMGRFIGDKIQLKVTGILKDFPDNTHLRFTILASMETIKNWEDPKLLEWDGLCYTYILLHSKFDKKTIEEKFPAFEKKYGIEKKYSEKYHYQLEPLAGIHLHSHFFTYLPDMSFKFNNLILYLFYLLGALVLIIASINFINLSTARSITRSKEVGIRKVIGATKAQLIKQFIFEFSLISFLVLGLAYIMTELFLPIVSNMTDRKISINYLHNYPYIFWSICITLMVTIISGLYPSIILSSLNPIKVLKNSLKSRKGIVYRQILTVVQFVASIILILTTIFIFKMIRSYSEGDLGFNQENLVILKMQDKKVRTNYYALKNEFLKSPFIKGVTASSNEPSVSGWNYYILKTDVISETNIFYISIDHDYLKTLEIKLQEGRDLNLAIANDNKYSFLINEEAKKQLALKNPIGMKLDLYQKNNESRVLKHEGQIVGVTNTFAYRPMYEDLRGVVLSIDTSNFHYAIIRIDDKHRKASIKYLKNVWQSFFPTIPFQYSNLKDDLKDDIGIKLFAKGENLLVFCSFLSMFIAIIGLFALTMFSTQQRIKELSIRKIFGSTVLNLLFILSAESVKLVAIANIIAGSFAFWFMKYNLIPQTKQMDFSVSMFIWVAICSLAVSLLSIIFVVLKTARANPVESLRSE